MTGGTYEDLRYEVDGPVARLTIDREAQRNALSWGLVVEMRRALAAAKADPTVRVVVLTGAGDRAFCAGADLTGMAAGAGFAAFAGALAGTSFLLDLAAGLGVGLAAFLAGFAGDFLATVLMIFFTGLGAAFLAGDFLTDFAACLGLAFAGFAAGFAFAGFLACGAGFLVAALAAFFTVFLVATRIFLAFLESRRRRVIA